MTRGSLLLREQASRCDQRVPPQPCLRLPNSHCPGIQTEAIAGGRWSGRLRRPDSGSVWAWTARRPVPGCEGHERKEEKKQQRLHRDPAEESPGLHQAEKHKREGACEKPPSTPHQPAHAPILAWIAGTQVACPCALRHGSTGAQPRDRGDRRPSGRVALGLPSEAQDRVRLGGDGHRRRRTGWPLGGAVLAPQRWQLPAPRQRERRKLVYVDASATAAA